MVELELIDDDADVFDEYVSDFLYIQMPVTVNCICMCLSLEGFFIVRSTKKCYAGKTRRSLQWLSSRTMCTAYLR